VWGHKFVTKCSQLPGDFQSRCGDGKEWQANDEGFIVWVGAGNSYKDGITKNLYQSMTGGCVVKGVVSGAIQGIKNCLAAGGQVNTPWGQRQVHWGMLTAVRDSNGSEINQMLGNALPLWKVGWSHNVQYKRLNFYGLIDKTFGNKTYNESRHWSWGDFMTSDAQQNGKSVETAKPIGYYWRSRRPKRRRVSAALRRARTEQHLVRGRQLRRSSASCRCRTTSARSRRIPATGA
jgi:hypothetical protein